MTIAVIILTYNEARHLARALESVSALASELIVVDSFSTDATVEIAEAKGARVFQRVFDNQARQFNWALDTVDIKSDWILRLDADEIVGPELATSILRTLPALPEGVNGINFKRKHIFMGRWIRFGGRYPVVLLRLWRRGCGRVEDKWMDEHVVINGGRTATIDGDFFDHNLNDLTYFTSKHNSYATREAVEVLIQKYNLVDCEDNTLVRLSSWQASSKRWVKSKIYNNMPFWLGPFGYFIFRMIFQLGFLDGREGLIYHFLQGFWYRFLVGAKVVELESGVRKLSCKTDGLAYLRRMTGLKL